ncbi:MAG: 3D domain-containing protein [Coriobacteriia bacterium]
MRRAPARPARFLRIRHVAAVLVPVLIIALAITGFVWAQKGVTVVVDGESRFMKTQADTVAVLLDEADIATDEGDLVTPSLDASIKDGMSILVRHSVPVRLVMAGETLELDVVGNNVADALVAAGADPGAAASTEPALDAPLVPGMTITAKDVFVRVLQESVAVPYATVTRNDPALAFGIKKVVTPGVPGKGLKVYQVLVANGIEGVRTLTAEQVVANPVDQVVVVGTKKPTTVSMRTSAGTTAAAPKGGAQRVVSATGYAPGSDGVDFRTATGATAGYGIIAVDPRVIPLGTRMYVPGYGYGVAADTGGAIKGDKIDLCFNTRGEALAWGRRTVTITILP